MRTILFKGFVSYLLLTLLVYLSPVPYAYANPVLQNPAPNGGSNVASVGSATIKTSGNTETITQTSGNAVVDWSSFNIAGKEKTQFVDPNSSSLTVNRVHDMNASQILGTLSSNGNIVLINPNGVFFGKGSVVDVNGIVATTSNVSNASVMSGGRMKFTAGSNPNATVENQGTITAADAGLVGLVAPNVKNSGIITANLGKIQMSSGDAFTLDFYGDKLLEIAITDPNLTNQLVQNSGTLVSDGGTVKLTAAAARGVINSLVKVDGKIETPAFQAHNGEIYIYAAGSNAVKGNIAANKGTETGTSTVLVNGTLDASGKDAGEKGGNISILGDDIAIISGSYFDASGALAGGNIKIGGDFHGVGSTPTASATIVQNNTTINANATDSGNGGNVVIWSDNYTNFAGNILAKGGPNGGNGGNVETSGHQVLNMQGMVDAAAPKGQAGTWLMDPAAVVISTGVDANETGNPSFVPSAASAIINTGDIITALNAGTNVTITTGGDAFAGNGSITVSNAITTGALTNGATVTGNLTLSSYQDILVNAAITLGNGGGSPVPGGSLTLQADNHANSAGTIQINAAIATNGGNITMGGGSSAITAGTLNADGSLNTAATGFAVGTGEAIAGSTPRDGITINNVSVNAGGGNIIMNGKGLNASNSNNNGVYINGASAGVETSGSGTINIAGIGQGTVNGASENGVLINNGTISAVDGDSTDHNAITIIGSGGGVGSGGTDDGVSIEHAATITTTGAGNIVLNGIAGDPNGSGNYNYGIGISPQGSSTLNPLITATGAGNIALNGTGGNDNGTGVFSLGIFITDNDNGHATINTNSGNITLTGTGGNSNNAYSNNVGVEYEDGPISSTSGNITITGTAGNSSTSGASNAGVLTDDQITTSGNIKIIGYGGIGNLGYNDGVVIEGPISATGSGTITIQGIAGGATADADGSSGISVFSGSISAAGGLIRITGTGGSSSSIQYEPNAGVFIESGGVGYPTSITNTGSGGITIAGTGSTGASTVNGYGVNIDGGNSVTTANGPISITGTGATGMGGLNHGIYFSDMYSTGVNNSVSTTGGTISLVGIAGGGAGSYGIINDAATNAGAQSIIGGASTGNITIQADSLNLGSGTSVQSAGNINILPYTAGTSVGVGTAAGNALNITDTELGYFTWGSGNTLTIGDAANTGAMTINTGVTFSNAVQFITSSGNDITLAGQLNSSATGNAIVLDSGRNFINSTGSTGSGAINLTGGGRFIGYSVQATSDTSPLDVAENINSQTYGSEAPATVPGTSNTWVYSAANGSLGGGGGGGAGPGGGGGGSSNGGSSGGSGGQVILPGITTPKPSLILTPGLVTIKPVTPVQSVTVTASSVLPGTVREVSANPSVIYDNNTENTYTAGVINSGGEMEAMQKRVIESKTEIIPPFIMELGQQAFDTDAVNNISITTQEAKSYQVADNSKTLIALSEEDNTIAVNYDPANDNLDNDIAFQPHANDNKPATKGEDKKKARRQNLRDRLLRTVRLLRSLRGNQTSSRTNARPDHG